MSLTKPAPINGLGQYMRDIGRVLTNQPIGYRQAYEALSYHSSSIDHGYASAVLIRLVERDIATETGPDQYVRGPNWDLAATHYGWQS
jgi:hypothetical protein